MLPSRLGRAVPRPHPGAQGNGRRNLQRGHSGARPPSFESCANRTDALLFRYDSSPGTTSPRVQTLSRKRTNSIGYSKKQSSDKREGNRPGMPTSACLFATARACPQGGEISFEPLLADWSCLPPRSNTRTGSDSTQPSQRPVRPPPASRTPSPSSVKNVSPCVFSLGKKLPISFPPRPASSSYNRLGPGRLSIDARFFFGGDGKTARRAEPVDLRTDRNPLPDRRVRRTPKRRNFKAFHTGVSAFRLSFRDCLFFFSPSWYLPSSPPLLTRKRICCVFSVDERTQPTERRRPPRSRQRLVPRRVTG